MHQEISLFLDAFAKFRSVLKMISNDWDNERQVIHISPTQSAGKERKKSLDQCRQLFMQLRTSQVFSDDLAIRAYQ